MPDQEQAWRVVEALEDALVKVTGDEVIDHQELMTGLTVFALLAVRNTFRDGTYYQAIDTFCAEVANRARVVFAEDGALSDGIDEAPIN